MHGAFAERLRVLGGAVFLGETPQCGRTPVSFVLQTFPNFWRMNAYEHHRHLRHHPHHTNTNNDALGTPPSSFLFLFCAQLRMLEGKDPRALLDELRLLQRKQVHPREADTILSTVHKAKVCKS